MSTMTESEKEAQRPAFETSTRRRLGQPDAYGFSRRGDGSYQDRETESEFVGWLAAKEDSQKVEWTDAKSKMPDFGIMVLIARRYVSEHIPDGTWIYYTGLKGEMCKPPYETCWFADEDELMPLADTWWKPIGSPPALSQQAPVTDTANEKAGNPKAPA